MERSKLVKTSAEAMKITAPDLKEMGIIDEIIPEILGGAHRDLKKQAVFIGDAIRTSLKELTLLNQKKLLQNGMKSSVKLVYLESK